MTPAILLCSVTWRHNSSKQITCTQPREGGREGVAKLAYCIKQLRVFLYQPGWDASLLHFPSLSRSLPQFLSEYPWLKISQQHSRAKRCTVKKKYLAPAIPTRHQNNPDQLLKPHPSWYTQKLVPKVFTFLILGHNWPTKRRVRKQFFSRSLWPLWQFYHSNSRKTKEKLWAPGISSKLFNAPQAAF